VLCEFCQGSLVDYIVNKKNKLTETEICKCAIQILEGLDHMHSKGICHRDLKVENILYSIIDGHEVFKLCDFGSANRDHSIAYNDASKT